MARPYPPASHACGLGGCCTDSGFGRSIRHIRSAGPPAPRGLLGTDRVCDLWQRQSGGYAAARSSAAHAFGAADGIGRVGRRACGGGRRAGPERGHAWVCSGTDGPAGLCAERGRGGNGGDTGHQLHHAPANKCRPRATSAPPRFCSVCRWKNGARCWPCRSRIIMCGCIPRKARTWC